MTLRTLAKPFPKTQLARARTLARFTDRTLLRRDRHMDHGAKACELPDIGLALYSQLVAAHDAALIGDPAPLRRAGVRTLLTHLHPRQPAVPIYSSITDSCIYCLECGCGYKLIRSHVRSHRMRWDDYLGVYGLPYYYPSVAPAESRRRALCGLAGSRVRWPRG